MKTEFILTDLPKHSLNKIYSGIHWSQRKKDKDTYKIIVKNQFKHVFSKDKSYEVDYEFNHKRNPLDASNCVYSLKLIEDIIFEDDKYNIVTKVSVSSKKSDKDFVRITVKEI